ncbi:hypothetical protein LOTGIDRAFT_154289 [Lottia gigantea]|uniref:Uncharacterized protein n=1 Tax=Lottia gigantea TaxID=225164 RepID=V4BKS7_LOTGI|nr:hypothetical protein LOTGIDRAFT_154289 [Lottia gigantea]ESO89199.1 hypothetical protein LOTGIDRAFT_154289 [Lottia gigantea]
MSAVLHKPGRKDYLRPSKTLQDLREKLGKVFIDAKIIECPQNAFELARLQKKIEELEKQRYRHLEEVNREQRILYNSLSSNYLNPSSVSSLSDPIVFEMVDSMLPPPGFRFHSNGNPKLDYLPKFDNTSSTAKNVAGAPIDSSPMVPISNTETFQHNSRPESPNIKYGDNFSSTRSSPMPPSTPLNERKQTQTPSITYNDVDYEQEIQNLEKIIKQLQKDMTVKRASDSTNTKSVKQKHNYLRAHSRTDEAEKSRFKYAPNPILYRPPNTTEGKSERRSGSHRSKCHACQMKLKHFYNDEKINIRKGAQNMRARWNLAPSGTYVQSPSSVSASTRIKSAPLSNLNYKRYVDNPESEVILKTYMIDHTLTPQSAPNLRATSAKCRTPSPSQGFSSLGFRSAFQIKRFSSPTERESKLQAFKSRAQIENIEAMQKVEVFLRKLKDTNLKHKQEVESKQYFFLNESPYRKAVVAS